MFPLLVDSLGNMHREGTQHWAQAADRVEAIALNMLPQLKDAERSKPSGTAMVLLSVCGGPCWGTQYRGVVCRLSK